MTSGEAENLLTRWSRRKRLSSEEVESEDRRLELEQAGESDSRNAPVVADTEDNLAQTDEVPVLTDADMPPVESLHAESDFSMFMSSGVSDELRNLALRQLFKAPVFNLRDGLDEYDEDFTSFEKLGDIVTCDMKHQLEMEAKKKLQQEVDCDSALDTQDPEAEKLQANETAAEQPNHCDVALEHDATADSTSTQLNLDNTPYDMVLNNEKYE